MKRKWIRWLVNRLLIACVLYAAFYTLLNLHLSSRIDATEEVLRGLGVAVSKEEFYVPGYDGPDAGPYWRAAAELWGAVAEEGTGESGDGPSTGKFVRAYSLKDGEIRHSDTGESVGQATLAKLREIVSQNEHLFPLLMTASRRPGYRSTLDYRMGFSCLMPHLKPAREMGHLCGIAAELAILDGDRTQAIEHWTAMQGLGRWQGRDLTLISQLVSLRIEQTLCHSVQESLKIAEFTEAELESVHRLFATKRGYERDLVLSCNAEMVYGGLGLFDEALSGRGTASNPSIPLRGVSRLWVKGEKRLYMATFSKCLLQARALYDRSAPGLTRISDDDRFPWYALLNRILTPAYGRMADKFLEGEAFWCLTDCVLHLIRYKKAHGQYPESLAQLPAGAGPFDDPFARQPVRYLQKGEGFVLYSVGENLQDDGGTADGEDKDDIVVAFSK
ncbi:MAG: hypothetical protein JSU70_10910 [Phycisphaerales bacterium]|nr:MAG: hypothetical protein JSU70_10910 [Phycisphaerales bacterium]